MAPELPSSDQLVSNFERGWRYERRPAQLCTGVVVGICLLHRQLHGFEPYNDVSWELQGEVVVIEAKLQKGNDIDPSQRNNWRYSWDAPSPEVGEWIFTTTYKGQEVYYLLLGYEPGREYRLFSMILIAAGDRIFRRVGLVYSLLSTTAFDNCQRRSVGII
jgi:hypothetical protein